MSTATMSKLPHNPKPIRAEPALIDALARELRPYTGRLLARAQRAVQDVLASSFQGAWDALLAEFRATIRAAVGAKAYRQASDRPVTDADRAKLPARGGPLRMMPEIAAAVEEFLAPFEGDELARKQAAVLRVYGSGVSGSCAQIVEAYRVAIEAA